MNAVRLHTLPPGPSRNDRRPLTLHGVPASVVRDAYRVRRSVLSAPLDRDIARACTLASFAGLADRIEVGE